MSRVQSSVICPECGTANPENARFCARCAARLGAEPSIVTPRFSAPSRLASPGAIPSRPAPLPTATHANNAAFWVKIGIGGLILMIGFIGWSVYVLTDVKVVTQVPTGQGGTTAAPAASVASPSPSPSASASASAALTPLVPAPSSTSPASSTAAASAVPAAPSTSSPPTPANASTPQAPARSSDAEDLQRRIEALEKQLAGQRARAASRSAAARASEPGASGAAAGTGGWVEPARAPAMTSTPGYQDAGPPVVRGPAPTVPVEVARPAQPSTAPSPVMPAPDLGPPVIEGPGPRYDFSRSGGSR